MARTITIQDLHRKSGAQVLEDYREQSSRWGESPLQRYQNQLRKYITALGKMGALTNDAADAMLVYGKALPPDTVCLMQEELDRQAELNRQTRALQWQLVWSIGALVGWLSLLYFVFVILDWSV